MDIKMEEDLKNKKVERTWEAIMLLERKKEKKESFIGCIIVWLGNVSIVKR